jgi:hypothetical protein
MKKITLIEDEQKIIARIPSAKRAEAIWARFEKRKQQAKTDRVALGKELHEVRKELAKMGGTIGSGGLFSRWLRVQGIPRDRAYAFIALAGLGKPKTESACYKRIRTTQQFMTRLNRALSVTEKKTILAELVKWVRKEYKF